MLFTVMKCFGRSETRENEFKKQSDAEQFIRDKLREDINLKINAIYRIYEGMDLLKEFTQKDAASAPIAPTSASESGSQQKGSRQVFSPSPLQTSPRPKGIMSPHWKNENEDGDKNKE